MRNIPELAKMVAVVHLPFASILFISMAIYSMVCPNREGAYPSSLWL
jgi:hypothetical protein